MTTLALVMLFAAADPPAGEWVHTVTWQGKPMADVPVGLIEYAPRPGYDVYPAGTTAAGRTNAAGKVRLPRTDPHPFAFARLLARDAAGHGGYDHILSNGKPTQPTLELRESTTLTGRVTNGAGQPIVGLKLAAVGLTTNDLARSGNRPVLELETPDWFWQAFPVSSRNDGTISLGGVPHGHAALVRFAGPGVGSERFWLIAGEANAIRLDPVGSLRVAFTPPAGVTPGRQRVVVKQETKSGNGYLDATAEATSTAGEAVTFTDLPPGPCSVTFPYAGAADHFPKPRDAVVVKPGATAEVGITYEPAARVSATLVNHTTGRGLAGGQFQASVNGATGVKRDDAVVTTGPDGKIELRLPAGLIQINPVAPDGFAIVKRRQNRFIAQGSDHIPVAAGAAHDFGTFAATPTVSLRGTVVDETGRPVEGAALQIGYVADRAYVGREPISDSAGRFTFRGVNPTAGLFGVTARAGNQITAAPVAVDLAEPPRELKVVVSDKYAARVRARLVDSRGRPMPGVSVEMTHLVSVLSHGGGIAGLGTSKQVGVTADDGTFTSDVVQPGDRYALVFKASGNRTVRSDVREVRPGETHQIGDVVLDTANGTVAGQVTDRAGQPVSNAKVFTNADGPQPSRTLTDAGGRFTLGGLFDGRAFISVSADGFALRSVPAEANGPPVVVKLRRPAEAPDPPPTIPDGYREASDRLVRHLLEAMWANRVAAGDTGADTLRYMARHDPATARRWRDEERARPGGKDLTAEIDKAERPKKLLATAKRDPDEAIDLLKALNSREGFLDTCKLADDLCAESPDTALRIAEEAVARARSESALDRGWALAQAGELVWRAGRRDVGRKLIEEAAAVAENLRPAEYDAFRRGMIAARVALFDAPRTRRLIDPIADANEFNRWLGAACVRLAQVDLSLVKQWQGDFRPDRSFCELAARQHIALRLAGANPTEAIAMAESIPDKTIRAVTCGLLAARLTNKSQAAQLIDRTVDAIVADPLGYSINSGGAAPTAALVLYQAKRIGHPDLDGVRAKVFAARSALQSTTFTDEFEPRLKLAQALALTDPLAARTVLDQVLTSADRLQWHRYEHLQHLLALGLANPDATREVVDKAIVGAVREKKGYSNGGLPTLGSMLTQPERTLESVCRFCGFLGVFKED